MLFIVQRLSTTKYYQEYCALFDKSTKIGARVDFHLINIFGYGGAPKYTCGIHCNALQNGYHENCSFLLKRHASMNKTGKTFSYG